MLTLQGGDSLVGGLPIIHITYQQYIANPSAYQDPDVIVHISGFPTAGNMPADYVGYDSNLNMEDIGNIATKAIAKVEPSDTALYLHEVGTGFINKDGNYCITDVQISVGGTITLGTNCHVVDGGISSNLPKLSNKVETCTVTPVLELSTTQVGEVTSNVYTVTQDCIGIFYWSHMPSGVDSQFIVYINSVIMIQIRTKVTDDAESRMFPFRLFTGDTVQLKSVNGCHATLSIRNYIN